MLMKIECPEFKRYGITRPPIMFDSGLNTVLGDQVGSNSIGKTTFLMIIDFAFGGNDYIDKSTDVQKQIGRHTIYFTFKFVSKLHYFSRDTFTHGRVSKCDSDYNVLEDISINEYRQFLLNKYNVNLPSLSFRDLVTRYLRIYGRDNLDEKRPLSIRQEKQESAIAALLKLFNMYSNIEQLRVVYKEEKDKSDTYNKSIKLGLNPDITKQKSEQNKRRIYELQAQLDLIVRDEMTSDRYFFSTLSHEDAKRISTIKHELAVLRHQRTRLMSRLNLIRRNIGENKIEFKNDLFGLQTFFPSINIRKIQEIEGFHKKLANILSDEFDKEKIKIEALLRETEDSIQKNIDTLKEENIPEKTSKAVLEGYAAIKEQIIELARENTSYQKTKNLRAIVKNIDMQLNEQLDKQLRELQSNVNTRMEEFNNFIYSGIKKAPILTLKNGKRYIFETPDDTGTGTSYKGLVVFDLSILNLTSLPVLIHDSVVLKQIADDPLEKILELYQKSGKQIFIALDKGGSYTERTSEILEQTAVLKLSDNGNELFGRSWNLKDPTEGKK